MSSEIPASSDTTPMQKGYVLDLAALDAWMRAKAAGYSGPLTVEQFKGGQSHPTYKPATPGRRYVLRKQPPGTLLKGAHAMNREVKVLTGLENHRPGFCFGGFIARPSLFAVILPSPLS